MRKEKILPITYKIKLKLNRKCNFDTELSNIIGEVLDYNIVFSDRISIYVKRRGRKILIELYINMYSSMLIIESKISSYFETTKIKDIKVYVKELI